HSGVRADRGRARGVGAAVQHDRRPDEDQVALPVRTMRVPHQGRVAVDVAGEGLLAPVPHLHRATRPQGQNTAVDLHAEICAGAWGSPRRIIWLRNVSPRRSAATGSVSASMTSYSTAIAEQAARACSGCSAATTATGSPA